jgi:PAS domain S-box-containing protein
LAKAPAAAPESERVGLLVDSIHDYAIFSLDSGGGVTSWNLGAEVVFGFRADEALGLPFTHLHEATDVESGQPKIALDVALRDGRYVGEGWRVRKGGERFWAHETITLLRSGSGQRCGFAAVVRDDTAFRNSVEVLRQSEERWRLMVQGIRDYAIFMLDPDGRIRSWNAGAERLKGYKAEEIIGRHFEVFYTDDARGIGHPMDELRRALAEGQHEEEGWRVRKGGTRFWASVLITSIHDRHGRHVGFAKVTRDLTERRRMEAQAREAEAEAVRERIRTVEAQTAVKIRDEFISVAAHELRTPLTALLLKLQGALLGFDSMIAPTANQTDKLVDRVRGAVKQVDRLGELVERLLDVSRVMGHKLVLNLEPTDLVALVRQAADDLHDAAAQAGSSLRLDVPDSYVGTWDKSRIEQVILNLLSNAIKYGRGKPIELSIQPFTDYVRLVVVDHGIGIAREDVERIFARFERAVSIRHYGGLGLGLYVTRNIVAAHGGSIDVVSTPNEGSAFTVDLPKESPR